MRTVFADTSFYVAISNPHDAYHQAAAEFARAFGGTVVTTEYVLIELGNFMARSGDREIFADLVKHIRQDPNVTIFPSGTSLFDAAFTLFQARPDKNWSMTDCISFIVMRDQGLTEALTSDHHFTQAGFHAVLL